ncbi:MAG: EAL domain-containing protein [Kangiellaceae bacterium]|nr:EAL domain-containing protein [Kangiellaceae bacterium]
MLDKFAKDKKLLWGFLILLWLNFVIFAATSYYLQQKNLIKTAIEQLQIKTEISGSTFDEWMQSRSSIVTSLAEEIAQLEPEQRKNIPQDYFIRIANSQLFDFLGYGLEDGFYLSNPWQVPADYLPKDRPWYEQSKKALRPTISDPYLSVEDGISTYVAFTSPIIAKGNFTGVVSGDVSFDRIYQQIISTKTGYKGRFNLIDRMGNIVLKKAENTESKFFSSSITKAELTSSLNPQKANHYISHDKIFAFYPLQLNNWWLAAEIDKHLVLAPAYDELRNILLFFVLIALTTYLLQRIYSSRVYRPIIKQLKTDWQTELPTKNSFMEGIHQLTRSPISFGLLVLMQYEEISSFLAKHGKQDIADINKQTLQRLKNVFGKDLIIGSIAHNQIAAFIPMRKKTSREYLARKLQQLDVVLNSPFVLKGQELLLPIRFATARYPNDGNSYDIINKAHIALATLEQSKANYSSYHTQSSELLQKKSDMLQALHQALNNDELHLVYQPQINCRNDSLFGVEVLARWNSAKLQKTIPPQIFIKLAEDNHLIRDFSRWLLHKLFSQIAQWQENNIKLPRFALNLSSYNLHDSIFMQDFYQLIMQYKIDPKLLEVEITEHVAIETFPKQNNPLLDLRNQGISISIDDFGTGYSSLSYLKQLPINTIKVDRMFIKSLPDSQHDAALCKAIIDISLEFDLRVIAEGVETQEQVNFLRAHNCYLMQGYLFAKPMSAEEFAIYLTSN